MSLAQSLERLRRAIDPNSREREGSRIHIRILAFDLRELLRDHEDLDARLRSADVLKNPQAYPPRFDMLARAASDPGAFAGYKGDRSMGHWIADAILAVERVQAPPEIAALANRLVAALPDRHPKYYLLVEAADALSRLGKVSEAAKPVAAFHSPGTSEHDALLEEYAEECVANEIAPRSDYFGGELVKRLRDAIGYPIQSEPLDRDQAAKARDAGWGTPYFPDIRETRA